MGRPDAEGLRTPAGGDATGQAYVTTLINALMRSPYWGSTAIFLSWDDWGGFYDHVVPPTVDQNGYGLRVPGLVISPTRGPASSTTRALSHDAYLKFIEDDFLERSRLNPATDGRPDARPDVREEAPGLGSLTADFNFDQAPRPPVTLPVPAVPGAPSAAPGSQQPPALETGAPTSLTASSATLTGTVDPDGGEVTDCHFDFGSSVEYGSSIPCESPPGAGNTPVPEAAPVNALLPTGTYHFRIVATNSSGTSVGPDLVFTTPPGSPVAEALPATGVTASSATLHGSVNPSGGEVSACRFEYGTSTAYGANVPCTPSPGVAPRRWRSRRPPPG